MILVLEKNFMYLFLASIFFLRIPSFYFLGIQETIFTTHALSLLVIIAYFFYKMMRVSTSGFIIQHNTENKLLIAFLFLISLSFFSATNSEAFLQLFLKVFAGVLVFFSVKILYARYRNKFRILLIRVLCYAAIIVLFLQLFLFIFPEWYLEIGRYFLYEKQLYLTTLYLSFPKLVDDTFGEVLVPFFFFFYGKETDKRKKIMYLFLIVLAGSLAFLSNFRDRFVVYITTWITSLIFLLKKGKRMRIAILITSISMFLFLVFTVFLNTSGRNTIVNRFLLQDQSFDVGSLFLRKTMIIESMHMISQFPFFGVGLGNFYDTLPFDKRYIPFSLENTSLASLRQEFLQQGTHNIFFQLGAEIGLVGLGVFLLLLCVFLKNDLRELFKGKDAINKACILSFWSLILFVQVHPAISLSFFILFFLLRGLIVARK